MINLIVLAALVFVLWRFGHRHVHRHGGHVLRIAFAAALILAVIVIVAPYAHAAEKPWTACGSTVTFAAPQSHGAPDGVAAAVAAAYEEVAAVADLTVMVQSDSAPGTANVEFRWDDPGAGIVYAAGSTASDLNSVTGVEAHVHYFSQAGPTSGPALKTLLLKTIGKDLGLKFQATGGHLTPADRAAVKASCKAQTSPTPSASSTPGAPAVTAAPGGTVLTTPATPATDTTTVTAGQKALGYTGAGIGVIALALVLAGGPVLRKLAVKAGVKRPSWSGIRDWVKGLLRRPSKPKTE